MHECYDCQALRNCFCRPKDQLEIFFCPGGCYPSPAFHFDQCIICHRWIPRARRHQVDQVDLESLCKSPECQSKYYKTRAQGPAPPAITVPKNYSKYKAYHSHQTETAAWIREQEEYNRLTPEEAATTPKTTTTTVPPTNGKRRREEI
jgi:hypothetical protein